MKNYIYSASQNMILPVSLKQIYVDAGTWPEDGTAISDEVAGEFMGQYPQGKTLSHDEDGQPCWADIPPLPKEQQIAEAEEKKQYLLSEAAAAIAPLQDAVDLGIATPEEESALKEWKKYRVLVNRVDTSPGAAAVWPTPPASPAR
ncbi:tail fiber assembly protein [Morganella morganii]|uniref:tail fiber assembly protein n=1 Tax=Morganella morganii TaxID=582 RepID=UPI00165179BC|nr:tail fiber assembly protein [Morganella morganii]MBC6659852.1 tail fiber assembly protein [Morganella morganii]